MPESEIEKVHDNHKPVVIARDEDDEPDEWDKRIFSTGCAVEQTRMNDCYYEKKDWRACAKDMQAFRECWKRKGNDQRTSTKDV